MSDGPIERWFLLDDDDNVLPDAHATEGGAIEAGKRMKLGVVKVTWTPGAPELVWDPSWTWRQE